MRNPAKLLLTTGAVLVVSASCVSDATVAPQATIRGNAALRALIVAQTTDFEIPTSGGEFNLFNAFTLKVPAGAVCDPNAADTQEGYAAAAWDSACTPASGNITVHATAKWSNGKLYVDFQPALRFVPSANVTLSSDVFADDILSNEISKYGPAIQYSPAIDAAGVSDALTDPSVRTIVQGSTGRAVRRIKHFSGYMIAGPNGWVPCDPNAGNPDCVWVDEDEAFKH